MSKDYQTIFDALCSICEPGHLRLKLNHNYNTQQPVFNAGYYQPTAYIANHVVSTDLHVRVLYRNEDLVKLHDTYSIDFKRFLAQQQELLMKILPLHGIAQVTTSTYTGQPLVQELTLQVIVYGDMQEYIQHLETVHWEKYSTEFDMEIRRVLNG